MKKKKKLYYIAIAVLLLVVLLVLSVKTGRFDVSFADHVTVILDKPAVTAELDGNQIQELRDILNGKKIWSDSLTLPRDSARIIFQNGNREITLYIADNSEGAVFLNNRQLINLTQSELKRIRQLLTLVENAME